MIKEKPKTAKQQLVTIRFPKSSEIISRIEAWRKAKGYTSLNNGVLAVLAEFTNSLDKSQDKTEAA